MAQGSQVSLLDSLVVGTAEHSPVHLAVLKFTLHYTDGVPYGTHNATAVFENGTWLVSQDSYCAVLSFGGATCPGR